jgi:hypothetical protein
MHVKAVSLNLCFIKHPGVRATNCRDQRFALGGRGVNMKTRSVVPAILLLSPLLLTPAFTPTYFNYIGTAFATDGDGGDGSGDGGDNFGFAKLPYDTDAVIQFLELKPGQNKFTAADMKAAVQNRKDGITVVIVGAGKGIEDELLNLAEHSPEFAARLLTKWSRLRAGDYKGMLRDAEKEAKKIKRLLERVKKGVIKDPENKLQQAYDAMPNIGDRIIILGLGGG